MDTPLWVTYRDEVVAKALDPIYEAFGLKPIPENAMRVGPGTDAVVWRICPGHEAEL